MGFPGAYKIPFFPAELIDQTIDHLHADKPSLKACSLVSRRWLNSTRHHLFRSTVIVGTSRPGHGFAEFLKFLVDRPNIGLHIQELRLQGEVNLSYGRPQVCKHELEDLLSHMPMLQKLDFFGVRFGGCDEECKGRLYHPTPVSFDQITLVAGSEEDDFADSLDILRLFAIVKHFYVYELSFRTADMPNVSAFGRRLHELGPPSQLQVRSFAIGHAYNPCSSLLCHVLRFTRSMQCMSAIGVECAGWDHVEAMGDMLLDLGPVLLHFHLDVALVLMNEDNWNDNPSRWKALQLRSCRSMKSISLMLLMDDQSYAIEESSEDKLYACTNILDILSTIQDSSSLRHVTIKLAFECEEVSSAQILAENVDWNRMLTVFNGFVSLQTVSMIFLDGVEALEECQPILLEKLHALDQQGMLDIKVLNDENLPLGAKI